MATDRKLCPPAAARAAALRQDAHETMDAIIRLAIATVQVQDEQAAA
jgi:hypothetical protein